MKLDRSPFTLFQELSSIGHCILRKQSKKWFLEILLHEFALSLKFSLKAPSLSLSHEMKNLTSDKLYFHFSWQFPLSYHEFCVLKRNEMKMLWSIIKCIKIFKLYSLSYMLPSSDNCEFWFSQKIMCCYKILFYPNNVAFGCFYKYDN